MEESKPIQSVKKEEKKANKALAFLVILIMLATGYAISYFGAFDEYLPNLNKKVDTNLDNGLEQLLNNKTLLTAITNDININYVNQFAAIPIYKQTPFGTEVYACSNITRVQ